MLMSTGLTFGTISALFGLSHGVITQAQYSGDCRRSRRERCRTDADCQRFFSAALPVA